MLETIRTPRADTTRGATKTLEQPKVDARSQLTRPWNVIVHDDPVTTMLYVVRVFIEIFNYGRDRAQRLMMEVHTTGRSIVWTGDREQAELYVHQLHARHLLAHVEPSEAE
jgi:ATP-dependent Clp protease adaptor protein ClpS